MAHSETDGLADECCLMFFFLLLIFPHKSWIKEKNQTPLWLYTIWYLEEFQSAQRAPSHPESLTSAKTHSFLRVFIWSQKLHFVQSTAGLTLLSLHLRLAFGTLALPVWCGKHVDTCVSFHSDTVRLGGRKSNIWLPSNQFLSVVTMWRNTGR